MAHLVALTLAALGCDPRAPELAAEPLLAEPVDVTALAAPVDLSAAPAFADERGGGLFIDLAGRVLRLRADGSRAALESHPRNPVAPGPASSLWPLGPSTALVVTDRGLFIADGGWLIAPPWQARLPSDGFVAVASGGDGIAWVAHRDGLFRVEGGELQELEADGASLTGITALTVTPGPRADPWFARDGALWVAAQTGPARFSIRDSGLTADDLAGGVLDLAGLATGPSTGGGVWVATPRLLLERTPEGWRRLAPGSAARRLRAAGRFLWVQSGDALLRYDAEARAWAVARGLEASPTLLAVDAAGSAWVRAGAQTLSVSVGAPLRVEGLHEGQVLYEPEALLTVVTPGAVVLESLTWRFDEQPARTVDVRTGQPGAPPQQGLTYFPLGGVEASGRARVVSFSGLSDGWHTLHLAARSADGVERARAVRFDLEASATAAVSYERDLKPLSASRCDKCHGTGTQPALSTYAQWKANAAAAAAAVRDRRMPADGPLDPAGVRLIQRWASGGTLP
ncbi:MAG: hypothetical protein INH41_27535 [Myxococcaceae bacterium]|nr:hypothetical protein [Myxococcaceae bacterium]